MKKKLYEPSAIAAARQYAHLVGDHGHSGGWIHDRNGRPIVQGWVAYAETQRKLRVIAPKVTNHETRWAIVWHRGKPTGLPITCDSSACPKVSGGLKGVTS